MPIAGWYATIARTALFGLVCSVIAGITVNLLKFVIGRARPRLFLTEGDYGFFPMNAEWAFNSFPSGHAQTVFTVATIVALAIPRTRYLCFFVATLVALSRVMISVHFVSDIVFGSFLGIGIVLLLKRCAYSDLETLSLEKYQTTGKQN
jgi:membrane-associated phospholipid phosphatase